MSWETEVVHVVCLITQAPIPGSDSLYSQMMVAYQQMVSASLYPLQVGSHTFEPCKFYIVIQHIQLTQRI